MNPFTMLTTSRRRFLGGALAMGVVRAASRAFGDVSGGSVSAEQLALDPRRPQYHLLPAANWMNDPNGPIYWQGNYHMFYQYNPDGAFWGDMHWGHAVSPDMVHWRHLPVAMAPTPGGPDAAGCFSGTAVADGDRVAFVYTGVVSVAESEATIRDGANNLKETQCLAMASGADLTAWTKVAKPVIARPPAGMNVTGFRDPSPWRQGDWWYMVVGSGVRGKGGAILLYRSKDLRRWEYLHVVASGAGNGSNAANPVESGEMWECPDLFPLGSKHVLIYSTEGKASWQSGELDTTEWIFHPQHRGILDYGSFYASKTQLDQSGSRILWGWVPETRSRAEYRASGWAGLMSLPRVLTLDADGQLRIRVAPAVEKLRQSPQSLRISANEEENQRRIAEMHLDGCCGEIQCIAKGGFGVSLVSKENGRSETWLSVRYDPATADAILIDDKPVPFLVGAGGEIDVRVYVDGSVMEVFVNDQIASTKRFYLSGSMAPRIGVRIAGETANLSSLSIWQLAPISANRLTT